jgi:hypothetical protein
MMCNEIFGQALLVGAGEHFFEVKVTMDECGSSSLNVAESAGEEPDPCSTRLVEQRETSLTAGGKIV